MTETSSDSLLISELELWNKIIWPHRSWTWLSCNVWNRA